MAVQFLGSCFVAGTYHDSTLIWGFLAGFLGCMLLVQVAAKNAATVQWRGRPDALKVAGGIVGLLLWLQSYSPTVQNILRGSRFKSPRPDLGVPGRPCQGRTPMARYIIAGWYTVPSFTTSTTRRTSLIRSAGLPSTRIRSASFPGATEPSTESRCIIRAALIVAI